jgi:hypothetical protein
VATRTPNEAGKTTDARHRPAPMGVLLGFTGVILLVASRFLSWESD